MAAYFETAPPVKHRLSGVERRTLIRKREALRGDSALQKNRRFTRGEAEQLQK
jgi:hypothetical protein